MNTLWRRALAVRATVPRTAAQRAHFNRVTAPRATAVRTLALGAPHSNATAGTTPRRRPPSRQLMPFVVALLASFSATRPALAHPLHTTVAELRLAPDGALTLSLRTFSDDFSAAVAKATRTSVLRDHTVSDDAAARYVSGALELDVDGTRVALQLVSQRRDGDVTLLELRAAQPCASLSGARVVNRMLMEFHGDQVNLLKASYAGRTFTTLFAQGAPPKTLP